MRKTPQKYLQRYLGKQGVKVFNERWSLSGNSTKKENEIEAA